jgi:aubergine
MFFLFQGAQNETIELYTNFFEIINSPEWALYQYHVDFDPQILSKALRCGLLKQHDNLFKNVKAFDGMTLFSMTKLDNEVRY